MKGNLSAFADASFAFLKSPNLRWLLCVLAAFAIAFGLTRNPSEQQHQMSQARIEECYAYRWLEPVYARWSKAVRQAEEMPLSGLYGQTDKLFEIFAEARKRAGPPPLIGRQQDLLMGMLEAIEGWSQLVERRPTADAHLRRSEALIAAYLADAKTCPPELP